MSKYVIQGNNKLSGEVEIAGAKNHALKILPATMLTKQICIIDNVPDIEDVKIMLAIMTKLGSKIKKLGTNSYEINNAQIKNWEIDDLLARRLRTSILFIAPLLARLQKAILPHPGGCVIGKRPINLFIDGFANFGVRIKFHHDHYSLQAKKMVGAQIIFPQVSHTGTESMIMAAVLARGETKIINAACEPEVVALCDMLVKMGAKIIGSGTPEITIGGVNELQGVRYQVIPDRLEMGSFIILAALNKGQITLKNCQPNLLTIPISLWQKIGVKMTIKKNDIIVYGSPKPLQAINIITHEYPGFPTDLQAPMTVLLTQSQGLSMVHETIYESRLYYTDMLNRMGANIILCDPHRIIIQGPTKLQGKKVESPDLRAGIAMLIAASIAVGTSEIDNIYQIDRGYEKIETRFQKLGFNISRAK